MTRDVNQIFADIDGFNPDDFIVHLTEDVVFRFGNADPAVGKEAVKDALTGFYSSIQGLTHHILKVWEVDGSTTIAHIDVEYRRHDGETVYIPNVDVLKWDGDLVSDWQIFIDVAPVYSPIDQVPAAVRTPASAHA
ncbi:nuclear transport factor 2 family protein [uncultured Microbacterium sp.]|uniref:nuclear transport factor 2 family protein n=1 Tax=uncultured Microbacterium sp. TaxID=191216 RepID=UPI0035CAD8FF